MNYYQQISFIAKSHKLLGWGDRNREELFLNSGNYSIFPQRGDHRVEDGINGTEQGPGAHPFLMMQISGTHHFAGIFLLNSNAMSLEVTLYNKTNTNITSL